MIVGTNFLYLVLEIFIKIGKQYGWKLKSEYVNIKTALIFECQKGHEFIKSPYWLKRYRNKQDLMCPECKKEKYSEQFKMFVKNKGGIVLTPYEGRFGAIKIKCKCGNEWKTNPGQVYQGNWCSNCKENTHPNELRKQKAFEDLKLIANSRGYKIKSPYINNNTNVTFECERGHKFQKIPKNFKKAINDNEIPCSKCRKIQKKRNLNGSGQTSIEKRNQEINDKSIPQENLGDKNKKKDQDKTARISKKMRDKYSRTLKTAWR